MFEKEISFIKSLFNKENIALHEPCFIGNEKKYLLECIDSGFVSSVGEFVTRFEEALKEKPKHALLSLQIQAQQPFISLY